MRAGMTFKFLLLTQDENQSPPYLSIIAMGEWSFLFEWKFQIFEMSQNQPILALWEPLVASNKLEWGGIIFRGVCRWCWYWCMHSGLELEWCQGLFSFDFDFQTYIGPQNLTMDMSWQIVKEKGKWFPCPRCFQILLVLVLVSEEPTNVEVVEISIRIQEVPRAYKQKLGLLFLTQSLNFNRKGFLVVSNQNRSCWIYCWSINQRKVLFHTQM